MGLRILIPLDTSATSECVLPHIKELAEKASLEVCLLHVTAPTHDTGRLAAGREPPDIGRTIYATEPKVHEIETATQAAARVEAEAMDYLATVAQQLPGIPVTRIVRTSADPPAAIAAVAREWGADLVAMATHGHSGLRRVLLGSVAEAVVRQAERPVMLVRASR